MQVRKDLVSEAITLGGHDSTLSAAEHETLVAMIMNVDLTSIGVSNAPPQEDMLYRLLEYASMAPVGTVLGKYSVPKGPVRKADDLQQEPPQTIETKLTSSRQGAATVESELLGLSDSSGFPADYASLKGCEKAETSAPSYVTTARAACQRKDNDGITYLSCQDKRRGASYDGRKNCWRTFSYYSGPGSKRCKGRCGPGCGLRARGKYTQDCLDHDACCGRYGGCVNGVFGSCSDEFRDAIRDTARGKRNCRNRWNR